MAGRTVFDTLSRWTTVAVGLVSLALLAQKSPDYVRAFPWSTASASGDGVETTVYSGTHGSIQETHKELSESSTTEEVPLPFGCDGYSDCHVQSIVIKSMTYGDEDCTDSERCEACADSSASVWGTAAAGLMMMLASLYTQRERAVDDSSSTLRTCGLVTSFVSACSLLHAAVSFYEECYAHPPAALKELMHNDVISSLGTAWYMIAFGFLNQAIVFAAHAVTPVLRAIGHPALAARIASDAHRVPMLNAEVTTHPSIRPYATSASSFLASAFPASEPTAIVPKMWPFSTKPKAKADICLIGCGAPGRGMGWYHAVQLLDGLVPNGRLAKVVEPWFLGGGRQGPGGPEFNEWAAETKKNHGVEFHTSIEAAYPNGTSGTGAPWIALVSGRTADNPRILREAIQSGCSAVYLEKPGAPSVKELEGMRDFAARANVPVFMGYNKNVCKYVSKARSFSSKKKNSGITFVSNNAYAPSELGECFERNAEGMLKNMAVHELALLVSFYDVTVENIESVVPDFAYSSCQTLTGPNGTTNTDFDKIGFTVTTKTGQSATVRADRCGGTTSWASVEDGKTGKELFRHSMPDAGTQKFCDKMEKAHPDWMPYFFTQHDDYIALKDRVSAYVLDNDKTPVGIASIDVAIETLRVAEYLKEYLTDQLTTGLY